MFWGNLKLLDTIRDMLLSSGNFSCFLTETLASLLLFFLLFLTLLELILQFLLLLYKLFILFCKGLNFSVLVTLLSFKITNISGHISGKLMESWRSYIVLEYYAVFTVRWEKTIRLKGINFIESIVPPALSYLKFWLIYSVYCIRGISLVDQLNSVLIYLSSWWWLR